MQASKRASLVPIAAYCAGHAFVDACCAALVFSASASGRLALPLALAAVVTYNLIAFAAQPILGWFVNDVFTAHTWARVGALSTVLAFVASQFAVGIWPAILLAGVGNAVFHLGGGVIALRTEPRRATFPGLYVAPGAAGLAAGVWMGGHQWLAWSPALALLLIIPLLRVPLAEARANRLETASRPTDVPLALILVFFSVVVVRAFVGSGIPLPWKADPGLLVWLTAAIVAGKAAGGILADRFGRAIIGVGALVLSAPLLVIAPGSAVAGIGGMFLFNMTMPVTLVAISDVIPERPGFAFGLTCLALIAGSLPALLHFTGAIGAVPALTWVLTSAALLLWGLMRADSGRVATAEIRPILEEAS